MHSECRRGELGALALGQLGKEGLAALRAADPEASGCRGRIDWSPDPAEAYAWPQVLPPQPAAWVAAARDAWVHGGNVYSCRWALHGGGCMQEFTEFPAHPRTARQVVALCDSWCSGYFHFVHEHLPRVALVLDELRRSPDTLVTVPSARFASEYLVGLLGLREEQLVRQTWRGGAANGGDVLAARVLLPMPQPCGAAFLAPVLLLRRAVFAALGLSHTAERPAPTLLVAARRRGRTAANWGAVVERLCAGLRCARFGNASAPVAEQVRLFNSVGAVFGPHGANLANLIWMKHGSGLVEVVSRREGNMCYYVAATRLGIRHHFLLHSGEKDDGNYTVAFSEAYRLVRAALRMPR
eukprot:TRINITY_DN16176_c0_g1_i1.p1 TRINITY_DN16176_c0_g1~~TRINITY_DN16176_c0_g1_i1.p1  ORF type:complete len:354 (+),score=105.27 TRINITY_DN16176_c0_g1_i1:758-1819(+)